ncbi:MAG TPA: glycerophosphodiester phosphodiesterase family protein [Chryseolinea sp.]|nr:glycerophosphodiester phosphodiesterase family protein [Chryseolinea sp.]
MKSLQLIASILIILILKTSDTVVAQPRRSALIVIAHRGDHTAAPENTLKAFEDAIAAGVDYVEVDVRASRDGELVVMHDATVDRMTQASGNVKDFNWQDLQKFTVTNKDHPEWGKHRIPSLAEVLGICKGRIGIYLDFKEGDIAKTWQLIKTHDMQRRVVVYINQDEHLAGWRTQQPTPPIMVSLPDSVKDVTTYKTFQRVVNAQIMDGSYRDYTRELVIAINKHGQAVWVDVQEREENEALWTKVLALGVQGMQTDHPRELVRWRAQKP